ncbi:MAG: NADH-quinone oxidoreductase subunit N [Armatimonadetes bacterium]|nr:NADH-quinone oxidoreductase subunit N [Armatimonadota bacterium]
MTLNLQPTAGLDQFAPEILLGVLGLIVLGIGALTKRRWPLAAPVVTLAGLFACLPLVAMQWRHEQSVIFLGSYVVDDLAVFFKLVAVAAGGLVTLIAMSYMRRVDRDYGEFFALLVWAVLGLCLMAGAADLIVILLAIETVSLLSYVMTGYLRNEPRSAEASLKYFLYGAVASAVMIYGMSLLYGVAGTTKLYGLLGSEALPMQLRLHPSPLQPIAAVLILVGLGFKIAMVPFHWWAPDAYEGAPTPVTAFLSVGPKAAGFAILARLFMQEGNALYPQWPTLVAVLAIATMFLGNWAAIWQGNIKRMLAYSSIAHAGYMLIGVVAWQGGAWTVSDRGGIASHGGLHAVLFYIASYLFMNLGAFAVAIAIERATGCESIERYGGMAKRNPFLAIAMTIFLLSLSGIPPLAGFFGKFYVFNAAIRGAADDAISLSLPFGIHVNVLFWLAVAGVVNSMIAVYYYMNVVRLMYFQPATGLDAEEAEHAIVPSVGVQSVIIITLVATFLLGLLPEALVRFLAESVFPGGLS